ncbi:kelch repeat-containing protein [Luteimonas sp. BDR2-5]|uniref:Kelch repeat-containing protein n=1 Tax=Proluteimonas luteida TaxID=2878685 RepID=UPI001E5A567D|nr:kelch repeat-containing protein [Luteimonas sp. BDR2-5]MCD9028364.1 kelch repeat-containing protein [Luteimonas sp. BDR2-5]
MIPRPVALFASLALALGVSACGSEQAPFSQPAGTLPEESAASAESSSGGFAWRAVEGAAVPSARHENAFAALDTRLYLLGGRGERPLEIFDPATDTWVPGAAPPLEIHHAQAVGHDGGLWVIGALTGEFPDEPPIPVVLRYDPATDAWSEGPAIPEARRRGGGGLVVHDGAFYLVGGLTRGHNGGYVPWLDRFDPATGAWTPLPDAPHPRDHFHAAVLDGRLYAAGGRTSSHETGEVDTLTVAPVDVYDIAAGTWSTLDAPIPTPRSGTATVAFAGRIIVLGGESGRQARAHDEVEAYDPATGEWETLPPLPVGRHGTQATVSGDAVHIVAGSRDRGGGPELHDHLVLELH